MTNTTELLKQYFAKREDVLLAFLFGSRAKGLSRLSSDWDIAVYFKPKRWGEFDAKNEYAGENTVRADIGRILSSDVDLVVLNRCRPSLVFSVLNSGMPLANKDMRLYFTLLSQTHYEAVDYWDFVQEYRSFYEKAQSLTPEARALLTEHLTFLENEFADYEKFSESSHKEYLENRDIRRNIERWIENCVMSALDIAKIILASEKKDIPQTYKDILYEFGIMFVSEDFAGVFSEYAPLRNILAHEYLDFRWERISGFLKSSGDLYPRFISAVKDYLDKE